MDIAEIIKENYEKIMSCKFFQGKTVEDIINTDRFRQNMAAYLTEQRETRKAAQASYKAMAKAGMKGYKLPSHVCDHFVNMSADEFAQEYKDVIDKRSGRSDAERTYIKQLGQQAYNLTMAQYAIDEFPELEGVLLPKSQTN